jgi:GT2 family glycosyltransferase/glycosyltransferase involved in cell wall biosynthesis
MAETGKEYPLVSIVVRTKNRPGLLKESLRSVAAQDYRPVEVVLVNDGGCELDIANIRDLLGDVYLLYTRFEKSKGRASAGNAGILSAKGKYVGFLDDDDELLPDHLSALVSVLEKNDHMVAYADSELVYKEIDPETGTAGIKNRRVFSSYDFSYDDLLVGNYIPLISILFKSGVLKDSGGFDESFDLYEDWDLLLRIGENNPFCHIKKITSLYSQWSEGDQIAQSAEAHVIEKAFSRIFNKHRDKMTVGVILGLKKKEEVLTSELKRLVDRYTKMEGELRRINVELHRKEGELHQKEGELSRINVELQQKEGELRQKEGELRQKGDEIRHKDALLYERVQDIIALRDSNEAMKSTLGWQLLEKVRAARDNILPPGSARRQLYQKAVDRIKGKEHQFDGELKKPHERDIRRGTAHVATDIKRPLGEGNEYDSYALWIEENEPGEADLLKQRDEAEALPHRPLISIIVPVFETDREMLAKMIESVIAQTYGNWELCIADGNSSRPYVREMLRSYAARDRRIKIKYLQENKHIAGNSNESLSLAEGAFVGFLDHDDELAPFALFEVVRFLNENPSTDFVYSDEDKINVEGKRSMPFFKPDWSPDLLLSVNYICHFAVLRNTIIKAIGGFRNGYEGAQDYDLFLRASRISSGIGHIPKILYHWREHERSTAANVSQKGYADESGIAALTDFFESNHINAYVTPSMMKTNYVVRYSIPGSPLISIIIPFKDKVDLLQKCIDSILEKTAYKEYEILLISNRSNEEKTFRYLDSLSKNEKIRVLTFENEFNYSKINNYAVQFARGDILLFLNNDTEVIESEWLNFMLEHAHRKEVGAVGCKLLFPDNRIQHAGVIVGITGFAGHVFAGLTDHSYNYFGSTDFVRDYLAVTGACLMVRREVFDEVGGFNESFIVCGSDVDFCLRIHSRGYRNIYTPYAVLFHREAASRGTYIPMIDFQLSLESYEKFLGIRDPYYNPNLTLLKTDCSLKMKGEEDTLRDIRESAINWAKEWEVEDKREKQLKTGATLGMIEAFDYSMKDLDVNRQLMAKFEKTRPAIKSINWFIPDFHHVYYGGIYTILRFAEYFSGKGIRNRFVLYDSPSALATDVSEKVKLAFPDMRDFEIFIRRGSDVNVIPYSDISIATLWTSAYRLLKFRNTLGKFYLIQDYEPLFYPAGASYALAEATYRFGFHGIVNSSGLYNFLMKNYDIHAEYFMPAVDHNIFFPNGKSSGKERQKLNLLFYGRPQHDRNAFELAIASAKKIKARLGDAIEIISAGSEWNAEEYGVSGIVTNLGLLSYHKTAELYRNTDFGLILMFTKHPSYLPIEFMASGSIVIANHNEANTWLLKDGFNCVIVEPSPTYITEKLVGLIEHPGLRKTIRENAFKTTRSMDWTHEMEKIFRFISGHPGIDS